MLRIRKASSLNLEIVNQNDLFEFMAQLTSKLTLSPKGEEMDVHVEKIVETPGANDLMTRVTISFSMFCSDYSRYKGTYETHRAKNFDCQNIQIKLDKLEL